MCTILLNDLFLSLSIYVLFYATTLPSYSNHLLFMSNCFVSRSVIDQNPKDVQEFHCCVLNAGPYCSFSVYVYVCVCVCVCVCECVFNGLGRSSVRTNSVQDRLPHRSTVMLTEGEIDQHFV